MKTMKRDTENSIPLLRFIVYNLAFLLTEFMNHYPPVPEAAPAKEIPNTASLCWDNSPSWRCGRVNAIIKTLVLRKGVMVPMSPRSVEIASAAEVQYPRVLPEHEG
jgi:hypothetical protein